MTKTFVPLLQKEFGKEVNLYNVPTIEARNSPNNLEICLPKKLKFLTFCAHCMINF